MITADISLIVITPLIISLADIIIITATLIAFIDTHIFQLSIADTISIIRHWPFSPPYRRYWLHFRHYRCQMLAFHFWLFQLITNSRQVASPHWLILRFRFQPRDSHLAG